LNHLEFWHWEPMGTRDVGFKQFYFTEAEPRFLEFNTDREQSETKLLNYQQITARYSMDFAVSGHTLDCLTQLPLYPNVYFYNEFGAARIYDITFDVEWYGATAKLTLQFTSNWTSVKALCKNMCYSPNEIPDFIESVVPTLDFFHIGVGSDPEYPELPYYFWTTEDAVQQYSGVGYYQVYKQAEADAVGAEHYTRDMHQWEAFIYAATGKYMIFDGTYVREVIRIHTITEAGGTATITGWGVPGYFVTGYYSTDNGATWTEIETVYAEVFNEDGMECAVLPATLYEFKVCLWVHGKAEICSDAVGYGDLCEDNYLDNAGFENSSESYLPWVGDAGTGTLGVYSTNPHAGLNHIIMRGRAAELIYLEYQDIEMTDSQTYNLSFWYVTKNAGEFYWEFWDETTGKYLKDDGTWSGVEEKNAIAASADYIQIAVDFTAQTTNKHVLRFLAETATDELYLDDVCLHEVVL
jgi:hypothetical protein